MQRNICITFTFVCITHCIIVLDRQALFHLVKSLVLHFTPFQYGRMKLVKKKKSKLPSQI